MGRPPFLFSWRAVPCAHWQPPLAPRGGPPPVSVSSRSCPGSHRRAPQPRCPYASRPPRDPRLRPPGVWLPMVRSAQVGGGMERVLPTGGLQARHRPGGGWPRDGGGPLQPRFALVRSEEMRHHRRDRLPWSAAAGAGPEGGRRRNCVTRWSIFAALTGPAAAESLRARFAQLADDPRSGARSAGGLRPRPARWRAATPGEAGAGAGLAPDHGSRSRRGRGAALAGRRERRSQRRSRPQAWPAPPSSAASHRRSGSRPSSGPASPELKSERARRWPRVGQGWPDWPSTAASPIRPISPPAPSPPYAGGLRHRPGARCRQRKQITPAPDPRAVAAERFVQDTGAACLPGYWADRKTFRRPSCMPPILPSLTPPADRRRRRCGDRVLSNPPWAARLVERYVRRLRDKSCTRRWTSGGPILALADPDPGRSQTVPPGSLGGTPVIPQTSSSRTSMRWSRGVPGAGRPRRSSPLADRFYGHREGRFRDPFGHLWILSAIVEALTPRGDRGADDRQRVTRAGAGMANGRSLPIHGAGPPQARTERRRA